MSGLLLQWLASALSLLIVGYLFDGISINGWVAILAGPVIIGLINSTLGFILKIVTFPLSLLSFGLFFLVINALMLQLATFFVPGFAVAGFWSAFFGAIVLSLINMILRGVLNPD